MPVYFCGKAEVWHFFSAPLIPTRCYFSATITRAELEQVGVQVWADEDDCSCVPSPPPVYFCGQSEVWHLFDYPISPTKCYYSYTISRAEVESLGATVRPAPPAPLPHPTRPARRAPAGAPNRHRAAPLLAPSPG